MEYFSKQRITKIMLRFIFYMEHIQPVCKVDVTAFITSLAKGGYVFGSVGLSVCLFVDNFT